MTVSIFSKFQYFTNYQRCCYFSHKNQRFAVEAWSNRVLASKRIAHIYWNQ